MKKLITLTIALMVSSMFASDIYKVDLGKIKKNGVTVQKNEQGVTIAKFKSPAKGKSCTYYLALSPEIQAKLNRKITYLTGEINFKNITDKPKHWNGIKLMLGMKFTNGKSKNPNVKISTKSSDGWIRYNVKIDLQKVTLKKAALLLGLENVGGVAEFRDVRITDTPVK